jgi:hypothetical protein
MSTRLRFQIITTLRLPQMSGKTACNAACHLLLNGSFGPRAVAFTKGGRQPFAAECANLRYRGFAGVELLRENTLSKC